MLEWFRRSKATRSIVPISRFLNDDLAIYATKEGGYGLTLTGVGLDPESLTQADRDAVCDRFAASIRSLPAGSLLYRYTVRSRGCSLPHREYEHPVVQDLVSRRLQFLNESAGFGTITLYWSIYIPPRPIAAPSARAKHSAQAIWALRQTAIALQEHLRGTIDLRCLTENETAAFYSYLLRLDTAARFTRLRSPYNVDQQIVAGGPRWHDDLLKVGTRSAKLFSLAKRPIGTRPNLFGDLLKIDCNLVLCDIWQPKTTAETKREVRSQEQFASFFHTNWLAAAAHIGAAKQMAKTASDSVVEQSTTKLGDILLELEAGRQYGRFAWFGLVHADDDRELRSLMPEIHRTFQDPANGEAEVIEESLGAMSGYHALFPGNQEYAKPRMRWLQDQHYAHLGCFYSPEQGHTESEELCHEYLNVYETRERVPFFFDPYAHVRRGLLGIGQPGTGKSLNGNMFVDFDQKYGGFTYIFDVGGSYETTVLHHGGTVVPVGVRGPRMNPFSVPESPEQVQALMVLVKLLLTRSGLAVRAEHEEELHEAIERVYALPVGLRRLSSLLLPPELQPGLSKWVGKGLYANVFDNAVDELKLSRLQYFDFQQIGEKEQELLEPLLFWLLRRINSVLHDPENVGHPKHLVFDEVWRALQDPQLLDMVIEQLTTGRKHLVGVTLFTQSVVQLGTHVALIRNTCPMTAFFGDPTFNRQQYAEMFQLNEQELDNIADLKPREWLLKWPGGSKILKTNVDPQSYWRYTTTPRERKVRDQAVKDHGPRAYELLAEGGFRK